MADLEKVEVATGIEWVSIPEAKLNILCGSPADAVKHLIKRGLIIRKEKNGVFYESGPNAILLSDILVQNGSFANLCEFPVLHMLYMQGLIIPGHPNNTGDKPILIGSNEQVNSQMEYIYRGNYGLISLEEIMEAGIPEEQAREMMRLKLKFAFGEIKKTEDLLDKRIIESKAIEIRNGVFVRRIRLNVFEIEYKGEFVTVNLNLAKQERYEVPYPLGYYKIKKQYFAIIHSGEGDGWDPNRPCMSSVLMFQGKIYLIDAGPNINHTLKALGIGVNEIEGIFHTHCHDDHFSGLSTLLRTDHKIKYYATKLVRTSVQKKISALLSIEEEKFSEFFEINDLEFNTWNEIEGLQVKPVFSPHPVETSIFFFRTLWQDGFLSYAHLADIASLDILENMISGDDSKEGISREFFEEVKEQYLTKATIKKLDIGGGLIHGKAEDFKDDPSKKIILSHTSKDLTETQREIGSGAPFGMTDILIPMNQDIVLRNAFYYFRSYFPDIEYYHIRMLMNNSLEVFNPETILFRENTRIEEIYMILTGNVEFIQKETGIVTILTAGALIGESTLIRNVQTQGTYRTINYVQALKLPSNLYLEFVKQNNLLEKITNLQDKRDFLKGTRLFGDSISYPILNTIAQNMNLLNFDVGKFYAKEISTNLFAIKSGKLQSIINNNIFETLSRGDYFGEEYLLYSQHSPFDLHAIEPIELYEIHSEILKDIPIVRWKLLETYERRSRLRSNPELYSTPLFQWREEYGLNIDLLDIQHKKIFSIVNDIYETLNSGSKRNIKNIFKLFVSTLEEHFEAEHTMMEMSNYPDCKKHKKEHERFLKNLAEQTKDPRMKLLDNIKDWIICDIMVEDMKFKKHLENQS